MKKFILTIIFILFCHSVFAQSVSRPISIKDSTGVYREVSGTSLGFINFSLASAAEGLASTSVYQCPTTGLTITAMSYRTYISIIATQPIRVMIGTSTFQTGLAPTYGESYPLAASVTVAVAGDLATVAVTIKQIGSNP